MKSRDNETLIIVAGVGVLAISLILPLAQKLAHEHDVSEVAARAVEVKEKLLSSTDPGKPLRVRVSDLVDGLSPDAALAEAEMRPEDAIEPDAVAIVARPDRVGEDAPAAEPAPQVAAEQPRADAPVEAIAPRDSAVHQSKRPGAAWIWEQ